MKLVICSAAIAALYLVSPAHGRDWYVSANGAGDGLSAGAPTQNLAAVLSGAVASDAVFLNGGDAFGFAPNMLTVAVALTLQSYGAGQGVISNTSIAANAQLLFLTNCSGVVIDNVQFVYMDCGAGPNPYRTICLGNGTSNITIRNCTFRHGDPPGGPWQGAPFIDMSPAAHPDLRIVGNTFCNLRYSTGYDYRNSTITARGADNLLVANNTVSNYENFLSLQSPAATRGIRVLSNMLYRCMSQAAWGSINNAGGLAVVGYTAIGNAGAEFAWNVIFNGDTDIASGSSFVALNINRGFNNGKVHNNTFYGLGAACLVNSANEGTTNLLWYNNILVPLNTNALIGFYSYTNGIRSGVVYSNIYQPFGIFTNEFYATQSVAIAGNVLADPQFVSLDPVSPNFLRPWNAFATNGLGGFIGALPPLEPPSPPFVDITNLTGSATVDTLTASYRLAGTNSSATVGGIAWSNSLGGAGSVPASATGWTFAAALTVGTNIVTATGTNLLGVPHADMVTIIRTAPTNAVLAVTPLALDAGATASSMTYQVANTGVGMLFWTNTVIQGGAWLSIAPASGAQNGVVTARIDRAAAGYGSHTGVVTVSANGLTPQTNVVVFMTKTPPALMVSPLTLAFGSVSTTQNLEVWNAGFGTLNWIAGSNAAWLSVVPAAGSVDSAHQQVGVRADRSGLAPNAVYTGRVEFIPSFGATQTVTATLSTSPMGENVLLQVRATRPGRAEYTCVRAIIKRPDGSFIYANEWMTSTWPRLDVKGIALAADTLVTVPVGAIEITLGKGPEYFPTTLVVNATLPGVLYTLDVALQPVFDLYQRGWRGGEIHDHYFHGEGEIFRTPQQLWRFCSAGGFDFLSMGEEHYLAAATNRTGMFAAWQPFENTECKMWDGIEDPKNFWGHYCAVLYDPWALRSPPPYFQGLYDIHLQGGAAFPNHPQRFYPGRIWVSGGVTNWFFYPNNNHFKEYPLDTLVGHVMDGFSGCSDVASGSSILPAYFAVLDRGYRIPFTADSDVCFDRLNSGVHAPGMWMVYYYLGSNTLCRAALADALRKGRTMATTGPLVLFTIDGAMPGDTLPADGSNRTVRIEAAYPFDPWMLSYKNFAGNQDCRVTEIALYRNGTLLQLWAPNTPTAVVTRVINESATGSYYMVRVLGNDGVWQAGYASPIYFDAAPRPPYPHTWKALVQGKLYDAVSGAALTGSVACVRFGQEYWRIPTDAQGLFQASMPIDAQLIARDARGREFAQDIMHYEPAYRFISYLSDTDSVSANAYMPFSIHDLADLVSTMRWDFPLGCQLPASFIYTNLSSDGVFNNLSIVGAPPAFPGNTHTEVALFMLDKTQAKGGDAINFACIYRQPLGSVPTESLSFELYGWNPDLPSCYNATRYIGGSSGTSGHTDLGGGFYARTGAITVPTWVSNKASTVAGIEVRARVRQTGGSAAWYEEMYLKVPIGPTRPQLLVNAVWDGLPGAWGDTGIGPYNFYRAHSHFENRYADYRAMTISFTLNGQPVTLCPTNATAHCADADDAAFYETFYYDAQCEPQYRNIPLRDPVRAQPAWPDFGAVPLYSLDPDPVPPIPVAMEPFNDQFVGTGETVQLYWHIEDVGSGASNATILLDGTPVAVRTTQNPIRLYPPLSYGQHQWRVIGWDNAGNCATSALATFVVDIPEPCAAAALAVLLFAGACLRRD